MAAASLVIMVLAGMLYWQYERVKFLENRPLLTDQALRHSGFRKKELRTWYHFTMFMYLINVYAIRVFKQFAQGKQNWKQIFGRSKNLGPNRPVSQRLRVICILISLTGIGLSAVFFAKIIQASVWENAQDWTAWGADYVSVYISLALLLLVVRDYQKFVHGMPSRTLSGDQSELLG